MDRADKVPVKRAAQGDAEAGPSKRAAISGPTGHEIVQIMNYWRHVSSGGWVWAHSGDREF